MLSDEWLPRYRLLENFNKVEREREGNAYDRGDYNSSFALRAVELKKVGFTWPELKFTGSGQWACTYKMPYNNHTNYFSESKFTLRIDTFEESVSIWYRGLPDQLSSMYR